MIKREAKKVLLLLRKRFTYKMKLLPTKNQQQQKKVCVCSSVVELSPSMHKAARSMHNTENI
jgi:hypothetical protein